MRAVTRPIRPKPLMAILSMKECDEWRLVNGDRCSAMGRSYTRLPELTKLLRVLTCVENMDDIYPHLLCVDAVNELVILEQK